MQQLSHQQALERLLVGNRRYAAMRQVHPRQTTIHRESLVEGQHPFAAILSCSDSRVPSELIFDQGLGDLFIVRTAGHAVNALVLASLEFAVFALHVPLVMVVGHGQCGAVAAVMKGQTLPGHLPQLVAELRPGIEAVEPGSDDALDRAIKANSRYIAREMVTISPVLNEAVRDGHIRIVPAFYDLVSGRVDVLE